MTGRYIRKRRIHVEKVILWTECALLMFSFVAYGYFIASTSVYAVLKRDTAQTAQDTKMEISRLEAEYFESTKKISQEIAKDYGLVAVVPEKYIDLSKENGKLSRKD